MRLPPQLRFQLTRIRLAILYSRLRKRSPIHQHPVAEAAVVALICSCINYLIVYLRGDQVHAHAVSIRRELPHVPSDRAAGRSVF